MKLASWNIEGLAKYEKDLEFIEYIKCLDIFGCCETWGKHVSQFDSFVDGYKVFTTIREKRYRKSRFSGGVTVFVKYALVQTGLVKSLFNHFSDKVLFLNGRLLQLENDILLCFVYIST